MDVSQVPVSPGELSRFLEIIKSVGSVGWAVVVWAVIKLTPFLKSICTLLTSIAETNGKISHDLANLAMQNVALSARLERIENHPSLSGPRMVPRSSTIRRTPNDSDSGGNGDG